MTLAHSASVGNSNLPHPKTWTSAPATAALITQIVVAETVCTSLMEKAMVWYDKRCIYKSNEPLENMNQIGPSPQMRGEHKKYLKPPPSVYVIFPYASSHILGWWLRCPINFEYLGSMNPFSEGEPGSLWFTKQMCICYLKLIVRTWNGWLEFSFWDGSFLGAM